jgi:hypothetical protein
MFKKIGGLIVTLLGLALLVYSATRSLNFIGLTLSVDKQVLAYFGLAALDGGLIAWLLAYKYGSRGGWQRGIALLMVIVDLLGAVLMFTADTVFETGKAGLVTAMSAGDIQTIVMMLSMIIALNIASVVAHDLTDPDRLKIQAEEEALGAIEEMALKQVKESSAALAAKLAPKIAAEWRRRTEEDYVNSRGLSRSMVIDEVARPALSAPVTATPDEVAKKRRVFLPMKRSVTVLKPEPVGASIGSNGNGNYKSANPTTPLPGAR